MRSWRAAPRRTVKGVVSPLGAWVIFRGVAAKGGYTGTWERVRVGCGPLINGMVCFCCPGGVEFPLSRNVHRHFFHYWMHSDW